MTQGAKCIRMTVFSIQILISTRLGVAITIKEPSGTIKSENYPNSYDSESDQSWKFRVPGATFYSLTFTDMDLDEGGCYDYIVIYDDSDYLAPGSNTITVNKM